MEIKLMKHQEATAAFWASNKVLFNTSEPGTGKTIATLEGYRRSVRGRLLVIAPLSILEPSWGRDITNYLKGFTYAIAHGSPKKRLAAFESGSDIVIINHDGVGWLADRLCLLDNFHHVVVDESTAFKNPTQRSNALLKIIQLFEYKTLLTGTPNPNGVCDLWRQALLLDGGERLGNSFWRFRSQMCSPVQVGPNARHINWEDKEESLETVTFMLSDITLRYTLDECTDIPPNTVRTIELELPKWLEKQYRELEKTTVLELSQEEIINPIHAGSLATKLLQCLSGCVYDEQKKVIRVHEERYNLVLQLVAERPASLVAFNWRHEVDALKAKANTLGIQYGVIDGTVPVNKRSQIVNDFQEGKLQTLFAHPQSAGHGLTLTRGVATIWCSPTYNGEHFEQFNRRIYRTGQEHKTETIMIAYKGTKEIDVYEALNNKLCNMNQVLKIFSSMTQVG